jgi:hypothetical protein
MKLGSTQIMVKSFVKVIELFVRISQNLERLEQKHRALGAFYLDLNG